jgi:hypothetical protein
LGILPSLSAVGEINYCCEKTVSGAWCQNAPQQQCAPNFRKVPTSCEATSFCKPGCCYDSHEGTCMENTPEIVCNNNGGIYSSQSAECDIPQCTLGCCLLGDQAAFVTQTRCKRLSAVYSLETNFRSDIANEMDCVASATSDEKGACVFEKDYETTCKILTQKECNDLKKNQENVSFHAGYLCSAETLGTNCGPTQKTTCVEGKDEIYFLDSCGNLANIYDSAKYKDKEYWTKMYGKEESCNYESKNGNAGSSTCGNCDYYLGSTCKQYDRTKDQKSPSYGNNICRDLSCQYDGKTYQHGETWCVTNTNKADSPGSEYFRLVCYNGEVTIEPCAAFRAETCIQSDINGFKAAACKVNQWQDCISQDNQKDCENTDKRDCQWIVNGEDNFVCAPKYAPGFNFWADAKQTEEICSIASTECTAKFEKGLLASTWKCVENCNCCVNGKASDGKEYEGCTGDNYEKQKNNFCSSLGDCGKKTNYIGAQGYNFNDKSLTCNGEKCYWVV